LLFIHLSPVFFFFFFKFQICRQQFVSLHSQPILEDLSKFLVSQFAVRARYLIIDLLYCSHFSC
jgi:hypothetical protein